MIEIGNRIAYDLSELSQKLQLSERTIRKYINSGKIQAFKLGLKYYVTQESIDQGHVQSSGVWMTTHRTIDHSVS